MWCSESRRRLLGAANQLEQASDIGAVRCAYRLFSFFFFQAEDGIRDYKVTGVQTCALPISRLRSSLVVMLSEALEARSEGDRNRGLQRLGDVSLFVAGFFAQSFARKLIDIDYHIAMGGRAYAALADAMARGKGRVLGQVFGELANNFQPM